jgi:hypothetical protein
MHPNLNTIILLLLLHGLGYLLILNWFMETLDPVK